MALLPNTATAEQDTEILSLLGSDDGPDWDATIMPAATSTVGISTHFKLGLRGFSNPQISHLCSHIYLSSGPSSPVRAAGAFS